MIFFSHIFLRRCINEDKFSLSIFSYIYVFFRIEAGRASYYGIGIGLGSCVLFPKRKCAFSPQHKGNKMLNWTVLFTILFLWQACLITSKKVESAKTISCDTFDPKKIKLVTFDVFAALMDLDCKSCYDQIF